MSRVSICIPVYNEEPVIPELVRRVTGVLDTLPGGPHEVVFVDDGSTDATVAALSALVVSDARLRLVVLSRNFGHQSALTAGLDHVDGDMVVVMDGDLQDAPEAIPRLLNGLYAGADVVYARRVARKEGLFRRAAYSASYRLIAALSDVPLPCDTGDFAAMSRRVVDALRAMPERQRYLRGLRAWVGFRQLAVDVERERRAAGRSKYRFRDLVSLALNGVFAFSVVPLRAASLVGVLAMLLSLAFTVYAIGVRLTVGAVPEGFTATLAIMTFLSGVQLLFLGVIGEYVGRVYGEAKGRPAYIVARIVSGAVT